MPKPSELPAWTTTIGNRVKPVSGAISSGFLYGQRPPPKWFNWLLGSLCDWVAWLAQESVDIQTFTSNGTWTKPANAIWHDIVLVGGGSGGNHASNGYGGYAGAILPISVPTSAIPASLAVAPGQGGAGGTAGSPTGLPGTSTVLRDVDSRPIAYALGGAIGLSGVPNDISGVVPILTQVRAEGGEHGTGGANGKAGQTHWLGRLGGAGATSTANGGQPGRGYGAGGGGGSSSSSGNRGGGGAGGWGIDSTMAIAGIGGATGNGGGNGAPGIAVIMTRCL